MPPDPPHASELVERIGLALYGPEWIAPLARLTGTNERTARRVARAARDGAEYPAARGLLAALHDTLSGLVAALEPYRRSGDIILRVPKRAGAC